MKDLWRSAADEMQRLILACLNISLLECRKDITKVISMWSGVADAATYRRIDFSGQ
jgi:hypothetical protein